MPRRWWLRGACSSERPVLQLGEYTVHANTPPIADDAEVLRAFVPTLGRYLISQLPEPAKDLEEWRG